MAGSTGWAASGSACGAAGLPVRHHFSISRAIAAKLEPTSTTPVDNSGTPPSCANGSSGPSTWPNATDPQGKPPNGTIDFSHSCAPHSTANQIGQPGNRRTTTADRPNKPGNSAEVVASTSQGTGPTNVPIHGNSGTKQANPNTNP